MGNGALAPIGPVLGPDDWTPGTYTSSVTQADVSFTQYQVTYNGDIPVCDGTAAGFAPGGTANYSGFAYGLYRYDVPGNCGGSRDFGFYFLLAGPGRIPEWTSLLSGGAWPPGIDYPNTFTIVNTFVPV